MSRYTVVTSPQLVLLSLLLALFTATLVVVNTWYMNWRTLPQVVVDAQGQCVKVVNFNNGDAFNCQDINLILRQYRRVTTE